MSDNLDMHWSCSKPIKAVWECLNGEWLSHTRRKMMAPPLSILCYRTCHLRKFCLFGLMGNMFPPVCVNMLGGSPHLWWQPDGVRMVKSGETSLRVTTNIIGICGGIFLFPSSMSPRDVILLTWSHIFDINLLTYFQICYCKDNIDVLEEPW